MSRTNIDFEKYVKLALDRARIESESGEWFAEIPGFTGVWATGTSRETALNELEGVLRAWLQLKLDEGDQDIPELNRARLSAGRP